MEKTIKLLLRPNGDLVTNDKVEDRVMGLQSENNATKLEVELCSEVASLSHYIEILSPNGDSMSSVALTAENSKISLDLASSIISEQGRYAIQYVGRDLSSGKVVKSNIIALDVDPSINAVSVGSSNNDFVTWATNQLNDLDARLTTLENGESAEVHSDGTFEDEYIIVADGTGNKKIKKGSKTIAQILSEASADATSKAGAAEQAAKEYADTQVGVEEERAKGVESGHNTRIGALETTVGDNNSGLVKRVNDLENGESAEVHSDSTFGTDEIILVADGIGKKIKAGTKTIAQILALISEEATARGNADSAEVTARNSAITEAVGGEKALREAADIALGGRIDALGLSSFQSISVSGASVTLSDLETQINTINTQGKHVFFDLHAYADRAYICTVTFVTKNNKKYCFIEDIINNKSYVNYAGIDGTELIADYVDDNASDKLQIVRITDDEMTFGDVKAILDQINDLGQHVLFDVSALGTGAYLCAIFISGLPYKLFDIVSGKIATGVYDAEEPIVNILTATKDVATKDQINDLQAQIDEIAGSSIIYGIRFTGNATSGTRLVSAEGLAFDMSQGINDFAARALFSDIYEVEIDSRDSSGNILTGKKQKFIHFPNFYFKRTKTLDSSNNIVESWYVSPIAVSGYSPIFKNSDDSIPSGFLVGKYEVALFDDTEALVGSFTGKKPAVNVDRNWVQGRCAYVQEASLGINTLQKIDMSFPKQAWDAIAILLTIVTGSRNHQSTFKGITDDGTYNPAHNDNVANQPTSAANYFIIPSNNYIVTNSSVGGKITIFSSSSVGHRWEEHTITAITADTPSSGLTKIEFDGNAKIMNSGTVRIALHAGELTGKTDSIVGDFGNLSTDQRHAFKAFGIENFFGNLWTILGGAAIKEIWDSDNSVAKNTLLLPAGCDYTVGSDYSSYIDTGLELSLNDGYVKELDFEGAVFVPTVTSGASSTTYFSDYYYQDHRSSGQSAAYRTFLGGGPFNGGAYAGSFFFYCAYGWTSSHYDFGFRSFILIP